MTTARPLTPGDLVTFVAPKIGGGVEARVATVTGDFAALGRVQIEEPDGQHWFIDATGGPAFEGVHWIRGHHALDSKEVAAMLAARALG